MIIKFSMWTPFHYFMMIFPFVLSFILYFLFRNKSETKKRQVALVISIIMVIILVMRMIYVYQSKGGFNPEVFPLQVCHFANFIFLLASISKHKVYSTIGWCLNFPAGLVSVVFANGLENYETMFNIQAFAYIAGHMLIVTIGLYMLLVNIIQITKKSLKQMYAVVGIMFLVSVIINNVFNKLFAHTNTPSNYFYTFKPEDGTPLESFFNLGDVYQVIGISFNPIYLLLLGSVGTVLLYGMYGIYKLRNINA